MNISPQGHTPSQEAPGDPAVTVGNYRVSTRCDTSHWRGQMRWAASTIWCSHAGNCRGSRAPSQGPAGPGDPTGLGPRLGKWQDSRQAFCLPISSFYLEFLPQTEISRACPRGPRLAHQPHFPPLGLCLSHALCLEGSLLASSDYGANVIYLRGLPWPRTDTAALASGTCHAPPLFPAAPPALGHHF